jgi:shikimate dehydrogenase
VLLGHPVAHSLSPRLQSAALRAAGLDVSYTALDVTPDAVSGVLSTLVAERAAGNVTIPHKPAVARACGRLTGLAERVGAVNTFWVEDGVLVGDNTDVGGFAAALTELLGGPPRGTVAILGAGGAAAAVRVALEEWPDVTIRTWTRSLGRPIADAVIGSAIVVNATPIGMYGDEQPIAVDDLPPQAAIMDLVYRAGETPWVRAAKARGLRAMDGLPMLLEQGALAFSRWFGQEPDRAAMRRAVTAPGFPTG